MSSPPKKLSKRICSDERKSGRSSKKHGLLSMRSHFQNQGCFCTIELDSFDDAIQNRLAIIRQESKFYDAHLRLTDCKGESKEVRIHRILLCACSPVFRELFNEGLDTVEVSITSEILTKVLDVVYFGFCRVTDNTLKQLLEAGHNYQIHRLLKLCHDFIQDNFCSRNLPRMLNYYRLSKSFLCSHLAGKLFKTIQRNFCHFTLHSLSASGGNSGTQAASELCLPNADELMDMIGDDELSVKEEHLLQYLLDWRRCKNAANAFVEGVDPMDKMDDYVDDLTMKELLENVRFGLISRTDLESWLRTKEMKNFLPGAQYEVENLQLALSQFSPKAGKHSRSLGHCRRQPKLDHIKLSSSSATSISLASYSTTIALAAIQRPRIPYEVVVVMGGWTSFPHGPTETVESYNWLAKHWTNLNINLPVNRAYHGLVKLDRKVYLVGGYDGLGPTYHNSLHRLDLDTLTWTERSCMDTRRCYVGAVALGNRLVAVGGHDGTERHNSVETYDPATNQWDFLPDMRHKRSDFAVVNFQERILVIGGFTGEEVLNSIEMYDPDTRSWQFLSPLTTPRSGVSAVVLDNKVYVLGGFNGTDRLKSVECFTPGITRNIRHDVPDLLTARSNFTATVVQGKIIVLGGYVDPSVSDMCELYCPQLNAWSRLPDMTLARSALNQVTISWDDTDKLPTLLRRQ